MLYYKLFPLPNHNFKFSKEYDFVIDLQNFIVSNIFKVLLSHQEMALLQKFPAVSVLKPITQN